MSPSEVWAPATQQAPPPPSQVQALVWHLLQTRGGLSLELPGCGTLLYPRNGSCLLNDSIWDPKFPLFLPPSCVNLPVVIPATAFLLDPGRHDTWYQEWMCLPPWAHVLLERLRSLLLPDHQVQHHGPMSCSQGHRDTRGLCRLDYGKNIKRDLARISAGFFNSCNFFLLKLFRLKFNM